MALAPNSGKQESTACVGILAADPLRSIGLQSILEEGLKLRTVNLSDNSRPRACKPNVLIVDENFDGEHGHTVPVARMLLAMPGVAVIVLARADGALSFDKVLAAGARAVLPETAQISEIRACIRAVLRGKTWAPRPSQVPEVRVEDRASEVDRSLAHRFTPKEREVMQWLAQGRSNREIATVMGIDEATVKAHLGRMLRKAEASNRVELTLRALAEQKRSVEPGQHLRLK